MGASALALAAQYNLSAITLDIYLPDIDGWRVLDRLKNNLMHRHIPVCVISTDDARERALSAGSLAFLPKPVQSKDTLDAFLMHLSEYISRRVKSLLIVDADETRREQTAQYLKADDVQITSVPDGDSALQMLQERLVDCVIVNPEAPKLTAVMRPSKSEALFSHVPVIVYNQSDEHHHEVNSYEDYHLSIGSTLHPIHSAERLLDRVSLLLHRKTEKLPENHLRVLDTLYNATDILTGKKVLIVDDDIRNIFALSSVLEEHGMIVVSADNGRDAIKLLSEQSGIQIALIDIMMPEMDGIDTMLEIRKIPACRDLPIIAVTAKAMKGDREKCMEAGAWDYLSKPVDTEILLAVLRSWLHR
jgi:CheY-like chemotaxis protein